MKYPAIPKPASKITIAATMIIVLLIFRFAVLGVKSFSYSPFLLLVSIFYCLSFELTVVHIGVISTRRKQFHVISLFDNVPPIHYENEIGIFDRRKPVRDNKTCPAFHERIHGLLNQYFRTGVN